MCKKCKNKACSSFDDGEPKPERDYLQEWLEGMKDFNIAGLSIC